MVVISAFSGNSGGSNFSGKVAHFSAGICNVPFSDDANRLDGVPGLDSKTIQAIIAEIGVDMSVFPTDRHIGSWAGVCPGNNESAGKRKSGKTTKGNPWLKSILVQAAHAAGRSRDNYLSSLYHRLAARKGKKRAAIAVAHAILTIVYHIIRDKTVYRDLGADYFDRLDREA
ncbi:MAG TPA: IS110 family transposase [Firmicutes bacterium]|nr:IS110 family transposase [Bacillota bacterium]